MINSKFLRAVPGVLAAAALSFGLTAANAQSANPSGPGNTNTNKAGEAYPNDPNAANPNKPKAEVVQKAENSRPVKATKRVAKKTKNAVSNAGRKTANAVRNTGNNIADKLPPAPERKSGVPGN
ncbi:MAG: hypothetical protein KA335_15530 [Ramlibacter sp.]|jgi:hypothetical protein|nr:hypothetical protein [Ramlibacter sp.]